MVHAKIQYTCGNTQQRKHSKLSNSNPPSLALPKHKFELRTRRRLRYVVVVIVIIIVLVHRRHRRRHRERGRTVRHHRIGHAQGRSASRERRWTSGWERRRERHAVGGGRGGGRACRRPSWCGHRRRSAVKLGPSRTFPIRLHVSHLTAVSTTPLHDF